MSRNRQAGAGLASPLIVLAVVVFSWSAAAVTAGTPPEAPARKTAYPASATPDQVCLTWSGDPASTQTVQWRTAPQVNEGKVQYREKGAPENQYTEVPAALTTITDAGTANDPVNHRFSGTLTGLKPGTAYGYRVGGAEAWSGWSEFSTAPQTANVFSFIYMGDPQLGLDSWGRLLHAAYAAHPEAAFTLVAGDNVNRGDNRNEWDDLFHGAAGVFDRRPYVPALGNHDYKDKGPDRYLSLLTLPENGPKTVGPERAYRLDYGNALFLVLDSNAPVEAQTPWVEQQLQSSKAVWKFAVYHHPAYSSAPRRDNKEVREQWGALFDRYHLDLALQGHDHGYLRTKPMRAGKEVASCAEGTVYVVSVSGTKFYEIEPHDFAAKQIAHTNTYQVIDIQSAPGHKLTYRAYGMDGTVLDELVIVK